jgi:hypothetical protein
LIVSAAASSRCSQLSITRRRSRDQRYRETTSSIEAPSPGRNPQVSAMVDIMKFGFVTGANSTSQAPSGRPDTADLAASTASLVFPVPPTPVSDTSRWVSRSDRNSSSCRVRPMNDVR